MLFIYSNPREMGVSGCVKVRVLPVRQCGSVRESRARARLETYGHVRKLNRSVVGHCLRLLRSLFYCKALPSTTRLGDVRLLNQYSILTLLACLISLNPPKELANVQ